MKRTQRGSGFDRDEVRNSLESGNRTVGGIAEERAFKLLEEWISKDELSKGLRIGNVADRTAWSISRERHKVLVSNRIVGSLLLSVETIVSEPTKAKHGMRRHDDNGILSEINYTILESVGKDELRVGTQLLEQATAETQTSDCTNILSRSIEEFVSVEIDESNDKTSSGEVRGRLSAVGSFVGIGRDVGRKRNREGRHG